jgi:hypothetical protein
MRLGENETSLQIENRNAYMLAKLGLKLRVTAC